MDAYSAATERGMIMAEYIEREKIVLSVLGLTIVDPAVAAYADAVLHQVQSVPAADVATVRHGHWNTINQITTGLPWKYRCSDCGCPQEYTHNYCPTAEQ